ncbi:VOC family protein [Micromonospora sp. DT227]|uniref:VOC family protein n=1 Tax=Micromonospora sp. DT227 TaxID=3393433 RepID=UPI003CEA117A
MELLGLDHLVLTVGSIDRSTAFYGGVLGLRVVRRDDRAALHAGHQMINLHQVDHSVDPRAAAPTPGAGDLCLVSAEPIDAVLDDLRRAGVTVVAGPVARDGALGAMTSVYVRDPDGNLVEIAHYPGEPGTRVPN